VCVGTSGAACDHAAPGDYDGDRQADPAAWTPGTGRWSALLSTTGHDPETPWSAFWGAGSEHDVPMPGDYDGDGVTDAAVWRPATRQWLVWPSGGGGSLTWIMGTQTNGYE